MVLSLAMFGMISGCGGGTEDVVDDGTNDQGDAIDDSFKVAMIYAFDVGDQGWGFEHNKAMLELADALDYVEITVLENVSPGAEAERTLRDLADRGYKVIYNPSTDYETDVMNVAPDYPDTAFLICSGTAVADNVESFWPRHYQLWYIYGVLAGHMSETGIMGITGAFPHALEVQSQNAFLLGAQSVNPNMEGRLVYLSTYFDPASESDVANSLIDEGADILAQWTNTPAHVDAAETAGVYAFSTWANMEAFGPNSYLSGDDVKWSMYLIPTVEAIYNGTWEAQFFYPHISDERFMINMVPLPDFVPADVKAEIMALYEGMKSGEIDPDFFWEGPISDNSGNIRIANGEKATDEELLTQDWFVQGFRVTER